MHGSTVAHKSGRAGQVAGGPWNQLLPPHYNNQIHVMREVK